MPAITCLRAAACTDQDPKTLLCKDEVAVVPRGSVLSKGYIQTIPRPCDLREELLQQRPPHGARVAEDHFIVARASQQNTAGTSSTPFLESCIHVHIHLHIEYKWDLARAFHKIPCQDACPCSEARDQVVHLVDHPVLCLEVKQADLITAIRGHTLGLEDVVSQIWLELAHGRNVTDQPTVSHHTLLEVERVILIKEHVASAQVRQSTPSNVFRLSSTLVSVMFWAHTLRCGRKVGINPSLILFRSRWSFNSRSGLFQDSNIICPQAPHSEACPSNNKKSEGGTGAESSIWWAKTSQGSPDHDISSCQRRSNRKSHHGRPHRHTGRYYPPTDRWVAQPLPCRSSALGLRDIIYIALACLVADDVYPDSQI